jgi:hypothetical protein
MRKITNLIRVGSGDRRFHLSRVTLYSEMNHTTTGCMGDGVCTPDRIELVDQSL